MAADTEILSMWYVQKGYGSRKPYTLTSFIYIL